jgi:hypothetical protein
VNLLSLSLRNPRRLILAWLRCMGASARESRVSVAIYSLDVAGRPGLHQSGLTSLCFVGYFSPGPRKNDLTIYWALGPFVRSFTPLVDPGDIYPPQLPCLKITRVTICTLSAILRARLGEFILGSLTLALTMLLCIRVRHLVLGNNPMLSCLRRKLKRPDPLGLKCDTITSPRRLVNTFLTSNSIEFR